MQGFVNVGADIGVVIAVLIPLIGYLMGGGLLIASIYYFWQSANQGQGSGYRGKAIAAFIIAPMLLSFPRMLDYANNTFGGGVTSSSGPLTSYTAPQLNPSGLMGTTPEETLLNIIEAFEYFFKAYGALIVLLGLLGLYRVMQGNCRNHHHSTGVPIVQMVFGLAVMNVHSIAATVMGYFA